MQAIVYLTNFPEPHAVVRFETVSVATDKEATDHFEATLSRIAPWCTAGTAVRMFLTSDEDQTRGRMYLPGHGLTPNNHHIPL